MRKKWSIIGDLYSTGMPAKVTWVETDEGDAGLSGDEQALADIASLHGSQVGWTPTGPFVTPDDGLEVYSFVLAMSVMSGLAFVGTTPEWPDVSVPDGAVA